MQTTVFPPRLVSCYSRYFYPQNTYPAPQQSRYQRGHTQQIPLTNPQPATTLLRTTYLTTRSKQQLTDAATSPIIYSKTRANVATSPIKDSTLRPLPWDFSAYAQPASQFSRHYGSSLASQCNPEIDAPWIQTPNNAAVTPACFSNSEQMFYTPVSSFNNNSQSVYSPNSPPGHQLFQLLDNSPGVQAPYTNDGSDYNDSYPPLLTPIPNAGYLVGRHYDCRGRADSPIYRDESLYHYPCEPGVFFSNGSPIGMIEMRHQPYDKPHNYPVYYINSDNPAEYISSTDHRIVFDPRTGRPSHVANAGGYPNYPTYNTTSYTDLLNKH